MCSCSGLWCSSFLSLIKMFGVDTYFSGYKFPGFINQVVCQAFGLSSRFNFSSFSAMRSVVMHKLFIPDPLLFVCPESALCL